MTSCMRTNINTLYVHTLVHTYICTICPLYIFSHIVGTYVYIQIYIRTYIRMYVCMYIPFIVRMCALNFVVYMYILYRYDPSRSKHQSVDPHSPSGGLLVPPQSTPASGDEGREMLDKGSHAERKMTSTRSRDVVEPRASLNDLKAKIAISTGGVSNRRGKEDMIKAGGRPGDDGLRLNTSKPIRLMSLSQISSMSQGMGDNIEVCIWS